MVLGCVALVLLRLSVKLSPGGCLLGSFVGVLVVDKSLGGCWLASEEVYGWGIGFADVFPAGS